MNKHVRPISLYIVSIRLAIITVTVILAVVSIIDPAIHAVTVIQSCLGCLVVHGSVAPRRNMKP